MQTYNVNYEMVGRFSDVPVIVRSDSPEKLVQCVSAVEPERLAYVQLLDPDADFSILERMPYGIMIDVVMQDVKSQFSSPYNFAKFLEILPIRITMSAAPGVYKALNIATALGFPVKIEINQPDMALSAEILECVQKYLASSSVNQPVEFFHSLLSKWCGVVEDCNLWDIQEENPQDTLYVTDRGKIVMSRRLQQLKLSGGTFDLEWDFYDRLRKPGSECESCDFLTDCSGYFKLPYDSYSCHGIKEVLKTLREASVRIMETSAKMIRKRAAKVKLPESSNVLAVINGVDTCLATSRSNDQRSHATTDMGQAVVFCSFECSNDCLFCAAADEKSTNTPELSLRVYDFISKCSSNGFTSLLFSGAGEPTLNPELADFVRFAVSKGITNLSVTTNGSELDEKLCRELVEQGLTHFCVSLHGVGPTHDALVRRRGSFEEALNAVRLLDVISPRGFDINTCITSWNISTLESLLEMLKPFGSLGSHFLTQPDLDGAALTNRNLICSFAELKYGLAILNQLDNPKIMLDNVPYCVAPHLRHRPRSDSIILLAQDKNDRYVNSNLNLGRNRILQWCFLNNCKHISRCAGIDHVCLEDGDRVHVDGLDPTLP